VKKNVAPDLRLVGREINDAIRNDGVHAVVRHRQMLDFAEPEFHFVQSGLLSAIRGVAARLGNHFRRHVHAGGAAGRADLAVGDENVEAAVEDELAPGDQLMNVITDTNVNHARTVCFLAAKSIFNCYLAKPPAKSAYLVIPKFFQPG
jgi:hypothetical protein